jgi:hypothetical protein
MVSCSLSQALHNAESTSRALANGSRSVSCTVTSRPDGLRARSTSHRPEHFNLAARSVFSTMDPGGRGMSAHCRFEGNYAPSFARLNSFSHMDEAKCQTRSLPVSPLPHAPTPRSDVDPPNPPLVVRLTQTAGDGAGPYHRIHSRASRNTVAIDRTCRQLGITELRHSRAVPFLSFGIADKSNAAPTERISIGAFSARRSGRERLPPQFPIREFKYLCRRPRTTFRRYGKASARLIRRPRVLGASDRNWRSRLSLTVGKAEDGGGLGIAMCCYPGKV